MENDEKKANRQRLLEWLKTTDVRPEHRASMACRIETNLGPHGTKENWTNYLIEPREREKLLFVGGPVSPEVEAQKVRDMTASERLEKANERGGNK